jgi:hypothetical protein
MLATVAEQGLPSSLFFLSAVLLSRFFIENLFLSYFIYIYSEYYWRYLKDKDSEVLIEFETKVVEKNKSELPKGVPRGNFFSGLHRLNTINSGRDDLSEGQGMGTPVKELTSVRQAITTVIREVTNRRPRKPSGVVMANEKPTLLKLPTELMEIYSGNRRDLPEELDGSIVTSWFIEKRASARGNGKKQVQIFDYLEKQNLSESHSPEKRQDSPLKVRPLMSMQGGPNGPKARFGRRGNFVVPKGNEYMKDSMLRSRTLHQGARTKARKAFPTALVVVAEKAKFLSLFASKTYLSWSIIFSAVSTVNVAFTSKRLVCNKWIGYYPTIVSIWLANLFFLFEFVGLVSSG